MICAPPDVSIVPATVQFPAALVLAHKSHQGGAASWHGAGRLSQPWRPLPFGRRPGVSAGTRQREI